MATAPGRPTVDQVALLLRARTKDSSGTEVGTFDSDTRPTDVDVESQIDAALALVGARFPDPAGLSPELQSAFSALVAYRAAMRIEKSYFPEQVHSDRSAYAQLHEEYLEDLQAFTNAIEAGGGDLVTYDFAEARVGSWTSIPHSFIQEYDTTTTPPAA